MSRFAKYAMVISLIFIFAVPAFGQNFRVVGSWSFLTQYKDIEGPFWSQGLAEKSNGKLKAEVVTTLGQINVNGVGLLRQMDSGIFDVGHTLTNYIVSDCPELAGLDLPALSWDIETARKVVNAYTPVMEEAFMRCYNVKLLGVTPYPAQMIFSKVPITKLADLKGKKVRGSGWTTAAFLDALGATGVTTEFSEVVQALNRGVIDAAIAGSLPGFNAGWGEVTEYLQPIPVGGWALMVAVMNKDTWNGMGAETQKTFIEIYNQNVIEPAWAVAKTKTVEGVERLTATGAYKDTEAQMKLVSVSDSDVQLSKKLLQDYVLPKYATQVGPDATKRWNDTIGKVVGLKAVPQ
ncbi:MAG: TRAP transporter substrate-binding protein [Desulfobacula sp.]|jgi:TRAP-type C4-dicarboxylate transport system substrate-binding protein|uniref:TRAP transporter substrate-binding protein n=2 Tax=Desulfobacula sp. TaxID=2593537 RepID=UPI001D22BC4C|nr:TRAP transporter substrate-binding protein [Desulfobacula sp.]MBT4027616.1 TRAP transporter substrate-binding protein [Desulfobacula sp.]MBT6339715.1 TRAP transporter substrate-binding protein [Desulfobacula sp.]MBT7260639.1 TRAP transporter substrate-binding protein [Desulfobacula sp.]